MIEGIVSRKLEPTVDLILVGVNNQEALVNVLIDTGFNGALSLSGLSVDALGYPRSGIETMTLADGIETQVKTFRGIVQWHGQPRIVDVVSADSTPLIGTELLAGNRVTIDMKPGGRVTIEPLP